MLDDGASLAGLTTALPFVARVVPSEARSEAAPDYGVADAPNGNAQPPQAATRGGFGGGLQQGPTATRHSRKARSRSAPNARIPFATYR